jgi:hypothetical protein
MARWVGISWLALCAARPALGQVEITGSVVDAENGKPIVHALATATVWKSEDLSHPDLLVVLTGEDGKFHFTGLPDDRFDIAAEKAGYLDASGRRYSHAQSIMNADLTMRLTRQAFISGTVKDDRGLPVPGAQVVVQEGTGKDSFGSTYSTDSDGGFRAGASCRTCYVGVLSPGLGTLLRAQGLSFAPVYYSGPDGGDVPVGIDMVPGREVRIDLRVSLIPAREIRGHLDDGVLIGISVLPAGNDNYRAVWGVSRHEAGSREFRISGLAPGVYVLSFQVAASSHSTFLRKIVQVGNTDVTDLVVTSADR